MEDWQATLLTWSLSTGLFWAYNLPYLLLDITRRPVSLYKYKLQPEEVGRDKIIKCVKRVLFNQFIVQISVSLLLQPVFRARGVTFSDRPLPSAKEVLIHVAVFILIEEALFYYSHRFLHYWNYKAVHKIHHEFRAPISIASEYAHPIEFVLSNMLPLMAGPLVMGSHTSTMWVWVTLAIITTSNHHCGYALPWLRGPADPRFHDAHHHSPHANFGVLGLLDRLHHTDVLGRHQAHQRRLN